MFRHRGKARTLRHNLAIASLLSFVAGMVNVVGFLSIQQLTTNVTGHFAYFMEEVLHWKLWEGLAFFLYILFFLAGAFFSNLLVELKSLKQEANVFVLPVLMEAFLLVLAALTGPTLISSNPNLLAYLLLFAMGMQNSLVTSISNATVRTTHLTGLFTDLGIELSQLFFYRKEEQRKKLTASIRLRLTIISFFFLGGIAGGLPFKNFGLRILLLGALVLIAGLLYDTIKIHVLLYARNKKQDYRNNRKS
ncbi:YoaK family protein [Flavihumibacter sp. UBA7668]|uniref:YoaK family protein n=1 Tax=Flavihumibacter sp. UBA7668 TaxID=1946542 RepID=UPI0025C5F775|nr:YoaK family protein [Flavihumibacter sp. UBA7668]